MSWVIFDGTNGKRIDSSGVVSVIRNSIGNYTINFISGSSNHGVSGTALPVNPNKRLGISYVSDMATSVKIEVFQTDDNVLVDSTYICAQFFGA
jgi:hypothetical protein